MKQNNSYLLAIIILTIILPLILSSVQWLWDSPVPYVSLLAQWFLFSAVGLRLFIAGIIQLFRPEFTLHHIFKITDDKSTQLVQEIGLHNLILGIAALLIPLYFYPHQFIIASMAGTYFGAAGLLHMTRKHASMNHKIAMISDLFIALMMIVFSFC